jgi:hypothetical protein
MCHVRPQKKAIHEVLTFSTTRVGKHHKKGSNTLALPTVQHKVNCVSPNAIKQRQRFVVMCRIYVMLFKAVML